MAYVELTISISLGRRYLHPATCVCRPKGLVKVYRHKSQVAI